MKQGLFLLLLCAFCVANPIEKKFIKAGLIDIHTIDSTIQVKLVNSNPTYNIFRKDLYKGLEKAYIRKPVAHKLKKAQKILQKIDPSYSLLIMDAARPRSASWEMYNTLKNTKYKKFVANPKTGSMHNYGIAVDITIVKNGKELDMGFSPFYKSERVVKREKQREDKRGPSKKAQKNRALLAKVMEKAGFYPLSFEWWHFNGMQKSVARKKYRIIE